MNANQKKYRIIENCGLLLADIPSVVISFFIAYQLRLMKYNHVKDSVSLRVFLIVLVIDILYHIILNDGVHFFSRSLLSEAFKSLQRSLVMFVATGFLIYAFRMEDGFSRLILGYFIAINFVLTVLLRLLIKAVLLSDFKQGKKGDRILLVTTSSHIDELIKSIEKDNSWSYKIDSIALLDCDRIGEKVGEFNIVANKENIHEVLTSTIVDVVFIYESGLGKEELNDLIISVQQTGAMCHCSIELPGENLFNVSTGKFADYPVITYSSINFDYRMRLLKRGIDVVGALVGLILTAIITPFVALAIKIDSPGPVFFKQTRLSKNGRKFKIVKFRTMYRDAEERKKELMAQNEMQGNMFKMENDPRITKVGAFLRKTSIDELPQFWNILMADMSLVGTRPPTVDEFNKYTETQKRRLSIRPGLTGMWQVSGRSKITDFDEIVKLDLEYIDNWSIGLDIKILFKTIWVVFARKGAS